MTIEILREMTSQYNALIEKSFKDHQDLEKILLLIVLLNYITLAMIIYVYYRSSTQKKTTEEKSITIAT